MPMDLEGMELPPPAEGDSSALDLSGEKGMEKEDEMDKPKVDLTAASDEEILKEAEARGLLEPEEAEAVSYTHLRAHETRGNLVCRLLLEKKK